MSNIKKYYRAIKNANLDLSRLINFKRIFRYEQERKQFMRMGGVIDSENPILMDYSDQAGSGTGHYFHQDLLVASYIYKNKPIRHIDIASRIDGFVAHVASFRKIEIMDVRDLIMKSHENIVFIKSDLMKHSEIDSNITDSISCLHAIEHFGLGRYGDRIDPHGHIKGIKNILRMLKSEGMLYISFPISDRNKTIFNAHRVFSPRDILGWCDEMNDLQIRKFDFVDDAGCLHTDLDLSTFTTNDVFGCGIYSFQKK
jgi:hypothetical protein